jgi:NADP-dependent 3-hydroxy acid dehydrogenase YdfG
MNVVMGYIQEDQVEPAMKLYKPEQKSRVIAIRHDVTDRDGWVKTLAQINAKFGNLHMLVNNAGIKTLRQASQVDAKSWDAAVAVNFTGIYNGCVAVIPHMLAHKEGSHIVTTSSMGGILPGVNAGVYTATKFASCGLMEALRVELMGTNIGTSVFLPGGVSTDNIASEAGTESLMMDPLEAGERVLNGVKNNDLFLFTHPEFKPGIKERCDAILASEPQDGFPEARGKAETRVLTAPPYAPEIAHRSQPRKSYRS